MSVVNILEKNDVKYLDVMKVVKAFEIYVYQQIIQHVLA